MGFPGISQLASLGIARQELCHGKAWPGAADGVRTTKQDTTVVAERHQNKEGRDLKKKKIIGLLERQRKLHSPTR